MCTKCETDLADNYYDISSKLNYIAAFNYKGQLGVIGMQPLRFGVVSEQIWLFYGGALVVWLASFIVMSAFYHGLNYDESLSGRPVECEEKKYF